jgi:hypothetical protein
VMREATNFYHRFAYNPGLSSSISP